MSNLSLRGVQSLYDELRLRYFMDAPAPLHVPPPASELRWGWLPETHGALGQTHTGTRLTVIPR